MTPHKTKTGNGSLFGERCGCPHSARQVCGGHRCQWQWQIDRRRRDRHGHRPGYAEQLHADRHAGELGAGRPGVGDDQQTGGEEALADAEALEGFQALCRTEGIIPALESSHAIAHGMKEASVRPSSDIVLINLSGRGDKDLETVATSLGVTL